MRERTIQLKRFILWFFFAVLILNEPYLAKIELTEPGQSRTASFGHEVKAAHTANRVYSSSLFKPQSNSFLKGSSNVLKSLKKGDSAEGTTRLNSYGNLVFGVRSCSVGRFISTIELKSDFSAKRIFTDLIAIIHAFDGKK